MFVHIVNEDQDKVAKGQILNYSLRLILVVARGKATVRTGLRLQITQGCITLKNLKTIFPKMQLLSIFSPSPNLMEDQHPSED